MPSNNSCPTCKAFWEDSFCSNCGEAKISSRDLKVSYLLKESISWLYEYENKKFWRTVYHFTLKPGTLINNYMKGSRVNTYSPLRIFAVTNLIFYLLFTNVSLFFSTVDSMEYGFNNHTINNIFNYDVITSIENASEKNASINGIVQTTVEETASVLSKTLIILFIPVIANISYFILKKKQYLTSYLLALHLISFFMLLATVFLYPAWYFKANIKTVILPIFYTINTVYLALLIRKTYNYSFKISVVKSALIILILYFLTITYKQVMLIISCEIYPYKSIFEYYNIKNISILLLIIAVIIIGNTVAFLRQKASSR